MHHLIQILILNIITSCWTSDNFFINTNKGSYFEYAIRNVLRNAPTNYANKLVSESSNLTEIEKMVYYYHLQILDIDMKWLNNWNVIYPNKEPSIFDVPSRVVQPHYQSDVSYSFNNIVYTLDSHRMQCSLCDYHFFCDNKLVSIEMDVVDNRR